MLDNYRFAGATVEVFNRVNRDERRREGIRPDRGWSLGVTGADSDGPNHLDSGAHRQDLCAGSSHCRMISARPIKMEMLEAQGAQLFQ